jgi:hypothetical protein
MSNAHHDEPLRWHWLYMPLVAFLVFAVGPSVLAPILFVLSLLVDIPPVQRAPDLISMLIYPLLLGLTCWPPFPGILGWLADVRHDRVKANEAVRLRDDLRCARFLIKGETSVSEWSERFRSGPSRSLFSSAVSGL